MVGEGVPKVTDEKKHRGREFMQIVTSPQKQIMNFEFCDKRTNCIDLLDLKGILQYDSKYV